MKKEPTVHYSYGGEIYLDHDTGHPPCGVIYGEVTRDISKVTCRNCRRTKAFKEKR